MKSKINGNDIYKMNIEEIDEFSKELSYLESEKVLRLKKGLEKLLNEEEKQQRKKLLISFLGFILCVFSIIFLDKNNNFFNGIESYRNIFYKASSIFTLILSVSYIVIGLYKGINYSVSEHKKSAILLILLGILTLIFNYFLKSFI